MKKNSARYFSPYDFPHSTVCCCKSHVEQEDDDDWVKRCMTWEVGGIRQRGRPKKTWWDCVMDDVESLGLSQKDAQFMNKYTVLIRFNGHFSR